MSRPGDRSHHKVSPDTFDGFEPTENAYARKIEQQGPEAMRDQIFISYSHKDTEWLERLQTVLKPLVRTGELNVWADTRIQTGQRWREEIRQALAAAKVAVLLVSPEFLASNFIAEQELPQLLKTSNEGGLTIVWVPIHACLYTETDIADYQAAFDPERPLASLSSAEVDNALVEISKKIEAAMVPPRQEPEAQPAPALENEAMPRGPVMGGEPVEAQSGAGAEKSFAPSEPQPAELTLNEVFPGKWHVQIQFPIPGALGTMQLQVFPNGTFHGELTTPVSRSVVDGQWQANPFLNQLSLQGLMSDEFQVGPYAAIIQVTYADAQQILGVSSSEEQVRMQRIGPPPIPRAL